MSKTLVGICAYGGLPFLKLGLDALREQSGFDVLVIVAKPGDGEMMDCLNEFVWDTRFDNLNLFDIIHTANLGFAAAINDMYDFAFNSEGEHYDNLIIMGNDVIPMPGTIEAMIRCADTTDYEMVCGSEFNARFLVDNYPEARQFFPGNNLIFTAWNEKPWLLHADGQIGIEPDTRKDIRNLTLFKKSSFEKAGYADINFWPNAYFEDNDYGRRCDLLGVRACGLKEAAFFHFTSRTIKQGEQRPHDTYFERNRIYYTHKWHGEPGQEKLKTPFGGGPYRIPSHSDKGWDLIPTTLKISTRDHEARCIEYWSTR